MGYASIEFREGHLTARTIYTEHDRWKNARLRHDVFCDDLRWVPARPDGLETDSYDRFAISLGIFGEGDGMLATTRLLPAQAPFMLEREFAGLIEPGHILRKAADTAEVTRLALSPQVRRSAPEALQVSAMLYKAIYQWCLANQVRLLYLVVEKRYWRALRHAGFPCRQIGPITAFPPAGVESVAAALNLDEARREVRLRRPDFFNWVSQVRSIPLQGQRQPRDYAGLHPA